MPSAIVGPYGQETTLAIGSDGYLSRITDPANQSIALEYYPLGLLSKFTDARGNPELIEYDTVGRLSRASSGRAGTSQTFEREDLAGGHRVTRTTALGRVTTYEVGTAPNGDRSRFNTFPSGLGAAVMMGIDGTRTVTRVDGTSVATTLGPDPRFGMLVAQPVGRTVRMPSGLSRVVATSTSATLSDPNDPFSLASETQTITINGRPFTVTFDPATRSVTRTSPLGRTSMAKLDALGRIVEQTHAGLLPTAFTYDSLGRLGTITQGQRERTRRYDAFGRLRTVRGPLQCRRYAPATTCADDADCPNGFVCLTDEDSCVEDPEVAGCLLYGESFGYDDANRLTAMTRPDLALTLSSYDPNGNVKTVTPPGRPAHQFDYTSVNLLETHTAPAPEVGLAPAPTRYLFDLDRALDLVTLPDASSVDFTPDAAGRLSTTAMSAPFGTSTRTYDHDTGRLTAIAGPAGVDLAYSHDGMLRTQVTYSGLIAGSVEVEHDNDFRVSTERVNGTDDAAFAYDDDGMLTQAGALSLGRDPATGLISSTRQGVVSETYCYGTATDCSAEAYGELRNHHADVSGAAKLDITYDRDAIGRVSTKTETLEGVTHTESYRYDTAGGLVQVDRDGASVPYDYDANGNRLPGTYDDQDRIVESGDYSYTFTDAGYLETKTHAPSGDVTAYTYDPLGNLRHVLLPDARVIMYAVDGENRRVLKSVDGSAVQGFLWSSALRVVAELDGGGNVIARFVYGIRPNVPEYVVKGSSTYRILTDQLGSVRMVVDTVTGDVVASIFYDAWGNVIEADSTGVGVVPFGFSGGLHDADTALVRFGARDYDPVMGRWTGKDPIGFAGGDANLYAYVGNAFNRFSDPSGLNVCTYECRGGYNHTWVEFDGDSERSYGFWPDPSNGLLAPFDLFDPGWFRHDDPSGNNPECDAGPPDCRASSPEEDAQVEAHLNNVMRRQPYFFGISDCRLVPDVVIRKLDELQGKSDFWRDFWDVFWNLW